MNTQSKDEQGATALDAPQPALVPTASSPATRVSTKGFNQAQWQPIANAPQDRPVLVWFDHDADPYNDPADPMRLTDYAANAEGGDFLSGQGVAIAHWGAGYQLDDGWEAANTYWMPGCWMAWLNNDVTDYAVNAVLWTEIPYPAASASPAKGPSVHAEADKGQGVSR